MALIMAVMAFLFIFLVTYAILAKTKILGGNNFIHLITSFLIAVAFGLSPGATEFTAMTIPWIGVLLVVLFCIILAFALIHGNIEDVVKSPIVAVIIVIAVLVIFLVSALNVFSPFFSQYAPGPSQKPGLISYLINPSVLGGIILIIVAAVASWVLTKK